MKNTELNEKVECYKFSHHIQKWMRKLLIIKEIDKQILNRAKEYYENDKGRLREHTRNKYRKLSNEEKDVKREYEKTLIPQYV